MRLAWLVLAVSVWMNGALLTANIYVAHRRGSPAAAQQQSAVLRNAGSPGDLCALEFSGDASVRFQAGLSRGLAIGPHNATTLADLLVVIPARRDADLRALWDAWGRELWDAGALELFTFDPTLPPEREPLVEFREFERGKRVRQVVWRGTEKNILNSLSEKVRRHLAHVCASREPHYARRRWLLKADTDSFVIPRHLAALLTTYDSSQPWYVGYQFNKGGYKYIGGGGYLMSRPVIDALGQLLAKKPNKDWRYEDMMIGAELASVGIRPTNVKAVHWKRPWMRQMAYGVLAPVVLVHKVKDDASMRDLKAWFDYVLSESAEIPRSS